MNENNLNNLPGEYLGGEKTAEDLPKISEGAGLVMLHADSDGAYFIDSEKKPWYFDLGARVWRKTEAMDLHPFRLQVREELLDQKKIFNSMEEAVNYAELLNCQFNKKLLTSALEIINQKTNKDTEDEEGIKLAHEIIKDYDRLIEIYTTIADKSPEEKDKLLEEASELYKKVNS